MKYLHFLIFFILLSLTFFAPSKYSYSYCFLIVSIFLTQNVLLFLSKEYRDLASFEFFFAFSFFICNFVYPIVYYPTKPDIAFYGQLYFNSDVINYSTSLAGLAYSSYVIGLQFLRKKVSNNYALYDYRKVSKSFILIILFISVASFIGFFLTGGINHLKDVYREGAVLEEVGLYSYFNSVFTLTSLLLAMYVFRTPLRSLQYITLIYIVIFSILLLLTGSRTLVIGVGLILLVSYSKFVKRISPFLVISFISLSSVLMSIIMFARNDTQVNFSSYNQEVTSIFDIFMDLIGTTRNLYILVDFKDNNFSIGFIPILGEIVNILPGSGRLLESLSLPQYFLGGAFPTYLEFGKFAPFGLGTSLVGEMYFGFGLTGLIIIPFFLGFIINYIRYEYNNVYLNTIYFIFVSHSVFYSRAFYLPNLRMLVWTLTLIFILKVVLKSTGFKENNSLNRNCIK